MPAMVSYLPVETSPVLVQLFERRLALTRGEILTRVSFSFYQKHSFG